jgi:hypothetical protein
LDSKQVIALSVLTLYLFNSHAIAAGPTNWDRATQMYESGNYRQALTELERINSVSPSVHYLRGLCYKNLGKPDQARRELTWVSQYSPDPNVKEMARTALEQLGTAPNVSVSRAGPVFSKNFHGGGPNIVGPPASGASTQIIGSTPSTASSNFPPPPNNLINGSESATVAAAGKLGWKPCPGTCLKLSTPGWHKMEVAGHPETDNWFTFDGGGSFTQAHAGHIIQTSPGGGAVDNGACPVCGGTGWVRTNR